MYCILYIMTCLACPFYNCSALPRSGWCIILQSGAIALSLIYRQAIIVYLPPTPIIYTSRIVKKNRRGDCDRRNPKKKKKKPLTHPLPPNSVDVVTDPCGFLRRSRIWRCTRKTAGGLGPSATCWARTATKIRKSSCVAGTLWPSTSRTSAGTGSSPPRNTRLTTVRASVRWCSYKSTRTPISHSSPTSRVRIRAPVRAALPASYPPYLCCTSTRTSTSSTDCYPAWWWIGAGAVRKHHLRRRSGDHVVKNMIIFIIIYFVSVAYCHIPILYKYIYIYICVYIYILLAFLSCILFVCLFKILPSNQTYPRALEECTEYFL